jgi:hypothetical protein
MSLTTTTNKQQYTANGSTTAFSFPYKFNANSHLVVVLTNLTTGVSTTQVIVTDYTVAGAGNPAGGTVTFVTAPADALRVTITREVPYTQEVDYQPDDDFPAEVHEAALDKLTMIGQQLNTEFDYALKQPTTDANPMGILPAASVRANKYLVFDANGNPQATASTSAASDVVNGSVTPIKLSTGGPSWDASGTVTATSFVAGNVGIGTSSPVSNLEIKDGTRSLRIDANLSPTGNTYISASGSTDGLLIGTSDAKSVSCYTNNTLRLSVESTGRINTQSNPITNCPTTAKAWVNFDGTTPVTTSGGTYNRSQTTVTVTTNSAHGMSTGSNVLITAATDSGLVTLFPNFVTITFISTTQFSFTTASNGTPFGVIAVTPQSIRSAYNVSSITKNGTGDYTINFATPMANANYLVSGCPDSLTGNSVVFRTADSSTPRSTTSVRVQTLSTTFAQVNSTIVQLQVFGN